MDEWLAWLRSCVEEPGDAVHAGTGYSPLRLSADLRRKLGRGAHYNVRLMIRGDLQTGKTSLWRRLQGMAYAQQVEPTSELGVAHVDWSCEGSADTVKVEVWDVVDADLSRKPTTPKLISQHRSGDGTAADAARIDVWRGAHAAIILFDPRKRWTFAYAVNAMGEAPAHTPVLLGANFADCDGVLNAGREGGRGGGEPGLVWWAEIEEAAAAETARSGRRVICARLSSVDCTGLDVIHRFLQLPYYCVKQAAHEEAAREAAAALERATSSVRNLAVGQADAEPSASATAAFKQAAYRPATAPSIATRGSSAVDGAGGEDAAVGALPQKPAADATPPRLAPPPSSGAAMSAGAGASPGMLQQVPRERYASTAASPGAPPAHMLAAALSIEQISDAFFDDDEGEVASLGGRPPPRCEGAGSCEGISGGKRSGGGREGAAPAAAEAHEQEGEEEEIDLLPLLDDPDA